MKTIFKPMVLFRVICISILLIFCTSLFYSCLESDIKDQEDMHENMISLMNSLRDAAIELDAEKIISMCLDDPEFLFCSEFSVSNFEQFAKIEREGFPNFVSNQVTWDTIIVKVLSPDIVSAFAPFRQIQSFKDGRTYKGEGEVTWIAKRTEEGLKLIYGHAGYRPDSISD